MLDGKKILITGGTGSLGQALTKRLLSLDVEQIRIFSRNENKQTQMESKFLDDRLRFFVGDIRDLPRLKRALEDVDIVFHAAALKHVDKIEYNPFEAIKTNVYGSQNVIDACLSENVEKAICIGTDKAVSPLNTYGATKLLMEKLFVTASNYLNSERHKTKFIAVRYGNVLGSSGSVIPKFIDQIRNNAQLTITDLTMTRFSITMNEALDFILRATNFGQGSEIFIPKLRAYTVETVKNSLIELMNPTEEKLIGIRPGEKLHETLINNDEMRYAWDVKDMYMITNQRGYDEQNVTKKYENCTKIENMENYSSNNAGKITMDELKLIIKNAGLLD